MDTATKPETQLKSAQQWKINEALTTDRNKKRIKLLQRSAPLSALLNQGHFGSKKLPHHRNKKTNVIINNTDVRELLLLWALQLFSLCISPLCLLTRFCVIQVCLLTRSCPIFLCSYPYTELHLRHSLQPLPVDLVSGPACWHQQTKTGVTFWSSDWPAPSREWHFPYRNPSTTQTCWILITERVSEEKELQGRKKSIKFYFIASVLRI